MTGLLVAAVLLLATSLPARVVVVAAAGTAVIAAVPVLVGPMALLAATLVLRRRFRASAVARKQAREDAALLADLTALALTGGLGIRPALELAAGAVGGEIADEVESLLRKARVEGLAAAMTGAAGAGRELYRVVGRAITTGSALLDQVMRVADELHADLGAKRIEEVRKVPVAMLFPLTLLILPGFLLLTIAPALLDAFTHLEI